MPDAPAGATTLDRPRSTPPDWFERLPAIAVGVGLVALAAAAYWLPGSDRLYNHFVWQADAFLHGRAIIDWPVAATATNPGNAFFQDVYPVDGPDGQPIGALLPFPPLPAIVLVPFVALWGLATNERAVSVALGAIDVGLAWWALGRMRASRRIRLATTLFFGFGTVFFYAAQEGTTWFFAHVVAVGCALLAVGVALGGDPAADEPVEDRPGAGTVFGPIATAIRHPLGVVDRRQLAAGLLFGLACTARLTVVFGAPFFLFVGSGGSWVRRAVSAGIGTVIPVGLLLAYNVVSSGQLFQPGYDYQYQVEATGYPTLNYHPDWNIEDIRYLPQNLGILFLEGPSILPNPLETTLMTPGNPACQPPDTERGLFDQACPIAEPQAIGMSILLTSPAYLLIAAALRRARSRLVAGTFLAVGAIAFVNLLHFSQGWVQFGYRFSNDFVPFALPLVAAGMARRGRVGWLGVGLVGLSVLVNVWGVIWGNILGW